MIGKLLSMIQRQKQAPTSWQSLLNRQDVLILDTETTGLSGQDLIVDLAMIDTTGAVRFDSLVGVPTGTRIRPEAIRIHGLDQSALKDAPAWPQIHDEVMLLLEDSLVCCWNAPFDRRMLHQTVTRHGLAIPPGIQWRDLLQEHRQLQPNIGSHSLEAVASYYGVKTEGSHRALPDCQTVLGVLKAA